MQSAPVFQPGAHGEAQVDLTGTLHRGKKRVPRVSELRRALFADLFLYEFYVFAGFGIELVHFHFFT